MEATTKKEKVTTFSTKEVNDFKRMCTIHSFKKREVVKDLFGVHELVIYLPEIYGKDEKRLSNVARYTNSRRSVEPCMLTKSKAGLKVTFRKRS